MWSVGELRPNRKQLSSVIVNDVQSMTGKLTAGNTKWVILS